MKKISVIGLLSFLPFLASAQDHGHNEINMQVFSISATIFLIGLCMIFALAVMRRILDYKLKNRIMEKGVPDTVISTFLKTEQHEGYHQNLKWFFILGSVGIGLAIVYYTMPLDIHSLAIMSGSISIGFLGYFIYMKKLHKPHNQD